MDSNLVQAKKFLSELNNSIRDRVEIDELGTRSMIPFKAMSIREPLLYRMIELSEEACHLYEAAQLASAFTLTRSALETAAMLFWLHMKIEQTVQDKKVSHDLNDLLMRALLGRKDKTAMMPINVCTFIDHVDKKFPVVKEMYDALSEYAHPNWFGVMSLYARLSDDRRSLNLEWPRTGVRSKEGTPLLCAALILFKFYYDDITKLMPSFVQVCDAALRQSDNT